jgi:hypothetical protein
VIGTSSLLLLAACNPPLVFDAHQPVPPNIYDRTVPDLTLQVFYNSNNVDVDSYAKPQGVFFVSPFRCIYVASPFRVVATASDLDSGIAYLSVGSPDILPIANTFVANAVPVSPTQVDDPGSPSVTYSNPGMMPGSHTVEVTYYTGPNAPGAPRGLASLEVQYNLLGSVSVADISVNARNTSATDPSAGIDAYFVRRADRDHPPGTACTPPP